MKIVISNSNFVRVSGTDYISTLRAIGFIECWGARVENGTLVETSAFECVPVFVFRRTIESNTGTSTCLIAFVIQGSAKTGFSLEPVELSPAVEEQILAEDTHRFASA